nr:MAG TPA: hypothetical protein [Caudoviricetes sp.]
MYLANTMLEKLDNTGSYTSVAKKQLRCKT